MQVLLIMILSVLLGGYYYLSAPSFRIEHEYSKTYLQNESEATCLAMQQQEAIEDNLKNQYDNNFLFKQYYPCSKNYAMVTKKYCVSPANEITNDCYQKDANENYINSHYIITRTKEVEGTNQSSMMKMLYKMTGGNPSIGLAFHADDDSYVIITAGKLEDPVKIPAKIAGDLRIEPLQIVYLSYYNPEIIKSQVLAMQRQELKCQEGFYVSYDTANKVFSCKSFNDAQKCFGDMIENSETGQCEPDQRIGASLQCPAFQDKYFDATTSSWECKLRKTQSCPTGQSYQFDGLTFSCLPNLEIGNIQGCSPIQNFIETDVETSKIRLTSSTKTTCSSSCEIPIYDKNNCQLTCLPGKRYIVQSSCLNATTFMNSNPDGTKCQMSLLSGKYDCTLAGYKIEENKLIPNKCPSDLSKNHNCQDYITIYWDLRGNKKWNGFDCFPLKVKSSLAAPITDGIISPYGFSDTLDQTAFSSYNQYWQTLLSALTTRQDGRPYGVSYFCDTTEADSSVCARYGKPSYVYSKAMNKCYDPLIPASEFASNEEKEEIAKFSCPEGYLPRLKDESNGQILECVPNLLIGGGTLAGNRCVSSAEVLVVNEKEKNSFCWVPPYNFPRDPSYGYIIDDKNFYGGSDNTGSYEITSYIYTTTEKLTTSKNGLLYCKWNSESKTCERTTNYNGCPSGTTRTTPTNATCHINWDIAPCPYEDFLHNDVRNTSCLNNLNELDATSCALTHQIYFLGQYDPILKEISSTAICLPKSNIPNIFTNYATKNQNGHIYYEKTNNKYNPIQAPSTQSNTIIPLLSIPYPSDFFESIRGTETTE